MITIQQFINIINGQITSSEVYYDAKTLVLLGHWDGDQNGRSLEIIFDPAFGESKVMAVLAHDLKRNRAYRLKDKDLIADNEAWDGVNYIDLETDEDMLEKMVALYNYEEYDDRIAIPLDLPDEVLLILMKEAHARDITFNQYLIDVITEQLKKHV